LLYPGYEVKVLADGYVYEPNGLIYKDFEPGAGELPLDGQQVIFHYSAYNESGGIIDSSYRQASPRPRFYVRTPCAADRSPEFGLLCTGRGGRRRRGWASTA
jgi:hypothetical protein